MIYDKVTHRKEEGSDEGGTDKGTRSEENLPSDVRVLLGVGLQFAERFHERMLTSVRAFTVQLFCLYIIIHGGRFYTYTAIMLATPATPWPNEVTYPNFPSLN